MATYPLIVDNDPTIRAAVWHAGEEEPVPAIGWNTSVHSSTNTAVATNAGTENWNLT